MEAFAAKYAKKAELKKEELDLRRQELDFQKKKFEVEEQERIARLELELEERKAIISKIIANNNIKENKTTSNL